MPAGLCAASTSTVGLVRTRSRRPGSARRRTPPAPSPARSGRWRPRPRGRPRRRPARWRRSAPGARRTAEEELLVLTTQALQPELLAADGHPALQHAELGALAGDHGLHLDGRGAPGSSAPGCWRARTAIASALMIPAFSPGDRGDVGAEVLGVVQGHRVTTATRRRRRWWRPTSPHADLDDRDVDRRVGEGGVGHADHDLEEAHRVLAGGVDHPHVRGDVVVGSRRSARRRPARRRARSARAPTAGAGW
jgi:hypothetical protein